MKRRLISLQGISLLFSCCVCFSVYAAEPADTGHDTWSLEALYQRALERSREIRIAEEQLYIKREDKNRAIAALIPDLGAFGEYTYYDELTNQTPDSYTAYGATLSQSFTLNGRELVAYKIAKQGISQAEQDLTTVREAYLFQVAAAYYQVLKYKATQKAVQADVDRLEAHKEAVLLQLRLEAITETQLYRTEAELSGSKTSMVQAENYLRSARLNLADLVDLQKDYTLTLPELTGDIVFDVEDLVATALANRSDLKSLKKAETIAQEYIRLSRGGFWPYLSLEGTYTRLDMDPEAYMPADPVTGEPDEDSFTATANIVFPLFEGGLRRSELSQSKARAKQAGLQVEALEKKVALEVRQAYLDMMTAKSAIRSIKDQVTSARKNYEAISRHFKAGLANSLDVMDANTLLTQSERNLVEARYIYELAVLGVKLKSGLFLKSIQDDLKTR